MRIVLDTNAFYAYIGPESFGHTPNVKIDYQQLNSLLTTEDNEILIPSVSLYEFFVKYSNKPKVIKNVIELSRKKIDTIYNIADLPFTQEEINNIYILSDDLFSKKIDEYKNKKIEVEAKFAARILFLLLLAFFYCYARKNAFQDLTFVVALKDWIMSSQDKYMNDYMELLANAYEKEKYKAQDILKDAFNKNLEELCEVLVSVANFVIDHDGSVLNDEMIREKLTVIFEKNSDVSKVRRHSNNINRGIQMMAKDFDKKNNTQTMRDYINNIMLRVVEKSYSTSQKEYLEWLFTKWLQSGGKYLKNDFLDLLIVSSLDKPNSILLTFDENMQNYIFDKNHISQEYINQVYTRN